MSHALLEPHFDVLYNLTCVFALIQHLRLLAHLAFCKSREAVIDSVELQGETYNSGHEASHHTSRGWNAHDDNHT